MSFSKGIWDPVPKDTGYVGIIYLETNYNIQLPFKGQHLSPLSFSPCLPFPSLLVLSFLSWLLILTTHPWNKCIPVVILVKHEAEQMLAEPQPPGRPLFSWQESPAWETGGIHFISAEGRIMGWWFTVRPKLYSGKLGDLHPSGTGISSQEVNYRPKLFHQLERLCNSISK